VIRINSAKLKLEFSSVERVNRKHRQTDQSSVSENLQRELYDPSEVCEM